MLVINMGYTYVMGNCFSCGILFTFHPEHVPSLVVDGVREPICKDCIARANEIRKQNGMDAFYVFPDAYEPMQIPW